MLRRLCLGLALVAAVGVLALVFSVRFLPRDGGTVAEQSGDLNVLLRQRDTLRVPAFGLLERSGKEVTLADLRGKVWITDFVWTRCPDACPLMSAMMARFQADFADAPDLRLISISVDPEYDTPAVLTRYAAVYGADPDRWLFLTGDKETIYHLVQEGFKLAVGDPDDPQAFHRPGIPSETAKLQAAIRMLRRWADPAVAWAHAGHNARTQPVLHSDRFVLVDRAGWIRGYYSSAEPEALARLKKDVRLLLGAG
ncbi:MAG: SCO family protein [Candidatus Methylomirabilales bacterium]